MRGVGGQSVLQPLDLLILSGAFRGNLLEGKIGGTAALRTAELPQGNFLFDRSGESTLQITVSVETGISEHDAQALVIRIQS